MTNGQAWTKCQGQTIPESSIVNEVKVMWWDGMRNLSSPAPEWDDDTVLEVARAGPGSEMSPSPLTRTTLASFCRRQQRKMLSLRILDADYKQKINMNSARDYLLLSQHRTQDGAEGWGWVSVCRDCCLLLEHLVLISSGPDLICNFQCSQLSS